MAVSFGASETPLLDWLGVQRRREIPEPVPGWSDLVLLDLPDHDSTQREHRAEVDRLVQLVDQLVFVMDPQKYADALIHRHYLAPLTHHRDIITVVLNQSDRLSRTQRQACLDDLRRLLDADGLPGVPLLATSATTGEGSSQLRGRLADLAATKSAVVDRLSGDLDEVALGYARVLDGGSGTVLRSGVEKLEEGLAHAAGVPLVVQAVRQSMLHRGVLVTGWPVVKWLVSLRPDPLASEPFPPR